MLRNSSSGSPGSSARPPRRRLAATVVLEPSVRVLVVGVARETTSSASVSGSSVSSGAVSAVSAASSSVAASTSLGHHLGVLGVVGRDDHDGSSSSRLSACLPRRRRRPRIRCLGGRGLVTGVRVDERRRRTVEQSSSSSSESSKSKLRGPARRPRQRVRRHRPRSREPRRRAGLTRCTPSSVDWGWWNLAGLVSAAGQPKILNIAQPKARSSTDTIAMTNTTKVSTTTK